LSSHWVDPVPPGTVVRTKKVIARICALFQVEKNLKAVPYGFVRFFRLKKPSRQSAFERFFRLRKRSRIASLFQVEKTLKAVSISALFQVKGEFKAVRIFALTFKVEYPSNNLIKSESPKAVRISALFQVEMNAKQFLPRNDKYIFSMDKYFYLFSPQK
jgi:hypothetical protein